MAETDGLAGDRPHKKPTVFNKDAAIGVVSGLLLGSMAPVNPVACSAVGAAALGSVGGIKGKKDMKEEEAHHAPPKKPSFWNKDALLGGLIGLASIRILTLGAAKMLFNTTSVAGIDAAIEGTLAVSGAMAMGILASAVTLAVGVGLYLGGRYGKKCVESEQEQQVREKMSQLLSNPLAPAVVNKLLDAGVSEVTPAEGYFSKRILEEQLLKDVPKLVP